MKKTILHNIQDIIESITRIDDYVIGMNVEIFMNNIQVQDAVMRRLQIIGEAVKKTTKYSYFTIQRYFLEKYSRYAR